MSDVAYDPNGSFNAGYGRVSQALADIGRTRAGNALAAGRPGDAANALYRSGDLAGGRQVQQDQAAQAAATRERELASTMQIVRALRSAKQQGQDVTAALDSYRPVIAQLGVDENAYAQVRSLIASDPNALDQIEQFVGQEARRLQIENLGEGYAVAIDPTTGQEVQRYERPRTPQRVVVGNDYVEVTPEGAVRPLYQGARDPEYIKLENSDGTENLVAVGGREAGVIGGAGAPARGGSQPRGLRNNNPGNIEDGPFARSLPGYVGSDGRFAVFDTPESGAQAAPRLLQSYVARGFDTPAEIINRWAPPSDNNPTNAYVNFVAGRLGIRPTDRVSPGQIPALAQAISDFENGQTGSSGGGRPPSGGVQVLASGQNNGPSPAEQRDANRQDRQERLDQSALRREFSGRQEVKDFRTVESAYNTVRAAARNPSAAGDLSLIFAYMKILDPGSVVREQEFANAQNAAGVPDQIRNAYNRVLNGQRLGENQRRDFTSQANNLYQARRQTFDRVASEYRQEAELSGFDPNRIVPRAQSGPATNAPGLPFNLNPTQLQFRQRLVGSGAAPNAPLGSARNPYYTNPADERSSLSNYQRRANDTGREVLVITSRGPAVLRPRGNR